MQDDEDGEPYHNDAESSSGAAKASRPSTIPLSAIPEALANLGLDSADPSVLSLFADTAYVPSSASRRRLAPGAKPEKVVGRQEFQQVASILLDEMQTRSSSSKKPEHRAQDPAYEEAEEEQSGPSSRRRPTRRAAVQGRRKAAEVADQAEDDDDGGGGGFVVDPEADDSEEDFEVSRQRRRSTKPSALDTGSDLTSDEQDYLELSSPRRRRRRAGVSASPSPTDTDTQHTPKRSRRTRAPPLLHSHHPLHDPPQPPPTQHSHRPLHPPARATATLIVSRRTTSPRHTRVDNHHLRHRRKDPTQGNRRDARRGLEIVCAGNGG